MQSGVPFSLHNTHKPLLSKKIFGSELYPEGGVSSITPAEVQVKGGNPPILESP